LTTEIDVIDFMQLALAAPHCHTAIQPYSQLAAHGGGDEFAQLIVISRLCNCKVTQFD